MFTCTPQVRLCSDYSQGFESPALHVHTCEGSSDVLLLEHLRSSVLHTNLQLGEYFSCFCCLGVGLVKGPCLFLDKPGPTERRTLRKTDS